MRDSELGAGRGGGTRRESLAPVIRRRSRTVGKLASSTVIVLLMRHLCDRQVEMFLHNSQGRPSVDNLGHMPNQNQFHWPG